MDYHKKLLIIGASGHGKVVADIASKMEKWSDIAFLDDDQSKTSILNFPVINSTNAIKEYIHEYDIFVAIGNNKTRKKLISECEHLGATLPILVHPSAIIGMDVHIGFGSVIMANSVINASTVIGVGCIINTSVSVDHDNKIGNYVHISPGAHLAGTIRVGDNCWIGAGAILRNNITLGENIVIGMSAAVIHDIQDEGTYIGIPARKMK